MSLYQLGISPLSPLHRQLSSPLSSRSFSPRDSDPRDDDAAGEHGRTDEDAVPEDFGGSGDEDEDGLTQDSRDVLVDRLNDLVQRLTGGALQDESISALHAKVDEMEKVLAGRKGAGRPPQESRRPRRLTRPRSLHFGGPPELTDELDPFGIVSPSWFVPQLYSQDSTLSSVMAEQQQQQQKDSSPPHDVGGVAKELSAPAQVSSLPSQEKPPAEAGAQPKISSEVAERIVEEAERLYAEMAEVVKSLQDRREESDHLHGLFIEREERAAQRIIQLEGRVAELEEEVQESESELRFLRLQLKAIEVQSLEYMPPDADPELVQSIQNWKSDWASLHRKWTERRSGGSHEGESFTTTMSSPGLR
ncbi:hypothetical protein NKR23_g7564 [Pleurostoma richardsiae]|uniref:Uncharacterized protein n=1 Tax=Pleurostoma richardsiae TaxID=41990 RepID=A0AA38RB38_9PEZI|nr:hypothetical protein NKR23_g7564 [Pleurostoma richardsiae]